MFGAFTRLLVLAAGAVALAWYVSEEAEQRPADDPDADDGSDDTLADAAASTGPFGTFHVAAKNAGLIDTLESDGPFTVFAPTDHAFAKLGPTLDELLANPKELARVLKYHIVKGEYLFDDLSSDCTLKTLAGSSLAVQGGDQPVIGNAKLVEPDVAASNGFIQGIDQVLDVPAPKKKSTTRKKKTTKRTKRS